MPPQLSVKRPIVTRRVPARSLVLEAQRLEHRAGRYLQVTGRVSRVVKQSQDHVSRWRRHATRYQTQGVIPVYQKIGRRRPFHSLLQELTFNQNFREGEKFGYILLRADVDDFAYERVIRVDRQFSQRGVITDRRSFRAVSLKNGLAEEPVAICDLVFVRREPVRTVDRRHVLGDVYVKRLASGFHRVAHASKNGLYKACGSHFVGLENLGDVDFFDVWFYQVVIRRPAIVE